MHAACASRGPRVRARRAPEELDLKRIDDGSVPATFQVIYLLGWKPDTSQVGPAARGSSNQSLKDMSTVINDLKGVPPEMIIPPGKNSN